MSTIQMESLSLVVFQIIEKKSIWQVKGHSTKWKLIYDFLYVYNTNEVSISGIFRDIWDKGPFDLWPCFKVKCHGTKWKLIYDFLYVYNTYEVSISCIFLDILEKSSFDLWPWFKVKYHGTKWKPIYMSTTQSVNISIFNYIIYGRSENT